MPGNEFPGNLRLLRPGIDLEALRRIGRIHSDQGQPAGVPRSVVAVPISPDGRVDDTVLFEDPSVAPTTYYLPRYRLRIGEFSGMYEITTELVDGRWRMTFGLESFPAPEIEAVAAAATILPHDLAVTVSSGGQMQRDYPVAEFSPGFGAAQVRPEVVLLLTLPERDALLRAFTRDEEQAQLLVRRGISVAVPAAPPPPRPEVMVAVGPDTLGTAVILPDLVLRADRFRLPEPIREIVRVPVPGKEPVPRPEETIQLHGELLHRDLHGELLHATGVGLREQLTVDTSFAAGRAVSGLSFRTPAPAQPMLRADLRPARGDVLDILHGLGDPDFRRGPVVVIDEDPFPNRGGGVIIDPGPVVVNGDPPPEPAFTLVDTTLNVTVPLRFDVDAHPYLFPSGQPPVSRGFDTFVVPWPAEGPSSRNHVYFHDQVAGDVFYHLPDAFLIGLRDQAPYGPELSFTVGRTTETDGGAERAVALMSAHLVPQTSPARLRDAARALAAHLPAGSTVPELRPAVHPATCRLELPGGAITTAAPPDLLRGWWVAESFDFDALRDVYAVLTTDGATSAVLRGRVDVDVLGDVHQVPVELRLDRLAAPPLSWTERPGPEVGSAVTVTLRNEGDVEITVPALPAWIDAGGGAVPATVTGALPARLGPGATLELTVTPDQAAPGGGPPDVTLDVTGVRVVVEPEQAVRQTLDQRVERLPRVVTLVTTDGGLGTTGDPERDLSLIGIQFDGVSGAALLDHTTTTRDIAVPVPLLDLLLDRGLGAFRFRQTLVHVSGTSRSDVEWRSTDTNLLALPQP